MTINLSENRRDDDGSLVPDFFIIVIYRSKLHVRYNCTQMIGGKGEVALSANL